MLGLGESDAEILETLADLRAAGVELVTLGQYLQPTAHHLAVERFVAPAQFDRYREQALALGFLECVAGPAGALQLSRRAGAEPQQRRARQRLPDAVNAALEGRVARPRRAPR